ncbi:MAG: hypothetical protein ACXW3Z_06790 [Limisphaerales bacterium]
MKPLEELNPIALAKEELRLVGRFAKRAERHQERFDSASAQLFREWLWRRLAGQELDVEAAGAIFPLIVAARRIALTERKFADAEEAMGMEEQSEAARALFGAFPPPIPFSARSDGPTNVPETTPEN